VLFLIHVRQSFKGYQIFFYRFIIIDIFKSTNHFSFRVSALFKSPGEGNSDNAMISIYPFGDEFFAFTESPIIHKIDPETLSTEQRVNVSDYVGIINHTSHPHVMADGTVRL
jgi:hypothetical protein